MTKVAKNAGINASDDDPGVILNKRRETSSPQVTQCFVESKDLKGAIIPSANFEPLPIAISAERTTVPLAHVAHNSVQRTLRIDDDRFSGLTRYLTADTNENSHGFGATDDSMFSVYAENVDFANPVMSSDIEDTGSNLPRIAERLNRSASNIPDPCSMELLHASQAEDLRKPLQTNGKLLGKPWRFTTPTVPRFPSSRRIVSSRRNSPTAWIS